MLTSFLLSGFLVVACGPNETRDSIRFSGDTMGTTYHVTVVAPKGQALELDKATIQNAIDKELLVINQHMSTYIPDSELMRLNAASVGEWHELSEPLRKILRLSQEISQRSDGAFDITVGPLVNLWGFGPQHQEDNVPSASAIGAAKAVIGHEKLELKRGKARKTADIKLDLSAIAKGFGVDWIANFLEQENIHNYMVEIGGEIRVSGVNPKGQAWRIAIERPSLVQQSVYKALSLTHAGMATSGDYRNYFEKDGKRYSHTLDPATGYPIDHKLVSVTVIAPTAAEADGWATAINVLGPDKGMEIADKEKLAVYMIVKDDEGFVDRHSEAFEAYK